MLIRRLLLTCVAATLTCLASPAAADQWNDKTILTFSEPVMIPGRTLPAGTYVFKIADLRSDRHVIRVLSKDEQQLIATVHAVPAKRAKVSGDIVVTFSPTTRGAAPAVKGWFYPGSRYGHEFIYSKDQARDIASRTRTLVLSADAAEDDQQQGTLRVYSADGIGSNWRLEDDVAREWEAWSRDHDGQAGARSSAVSIDADFAGWRVGLDALESQPMKYLGQRVSVDGEVDEVLGPRVFKIDEPNWADLEGELLVTMPSNLIALVREGDMVTVSGTVQPFVKADIQRNENSVGFDEETEVLLSRKPVIVATRIVGGKGGRALIIETRPESAGAQATQESHSEGASGSLSDSAKGTDSTGITDAADVAHADSVAIGRHVSLSHIPVTGVVARGFVVSTPDGQFFVQPATGLDGVAAGQNVSIAGVVLEMPARMRRGLKSADAHGEISMNSDIYVYATKVTTPS